MTKAVFGGKPRAFKTPEELEQKLEEYKNFTKEQQLTNERYTPTVLAFSEFANVDNHILTVDWLNDPERSEFHPTIKKIVQFCEAELIGNALTNKANPIFSMFLLKCKHNYIDKQVIEQNTTHTFSLRGLHAGADELAAANTVELVEPQQLADTKDEV